MDWVIIEVSSQITTLQYKYRRKSALREIMRHMSVQDVKSSRRKYSIHAVSKRPHHMFAVMIM